MIYLHIHSEYLYLCCRDVVYQMNLKVDFEAVSGYDRMMLAELGLPQISSIQIDERKTLAWAHL